MKKILITGGAGYIGSVLTRLLLEQGFEVEVLDNFIYDQNSLIDCCSFKKFTFNNIDILDYDKVNERVKNKDIIIPLAAYVGAPICKIRKTVSKLVNLDSIKNIVENTSDDQLIIFPTTNSGYGVGSKDEYCTEASSLNPVSEYGIWKVEAEKLILNRKNSISFRLATVFGVSQRMRLDLLVNNFTHKAYTDKYIVLFEENFRRNFIHIKDVANAFLFAIKNCEIMKGDVFNVGLSDANLTKLQLCNKIKEYLPKFIIYSSNLDKDEDQRDYIVSNEKFEKIGWKPEFSLDDGILELIKFFSMIKKNSYSNI